MTSEISEASAVTCEGTDRPKELIVGGYRSMSSAIELDKILGL